MHPLFVVLDLDGTLTVEGTTTLCPDTKRLLETLKSQGHFLSVCSNNSKAKWNLKTLGILEYFDIVIGHPSSSGKQQEMMEIWRYYRCLLDHHLIKTKIELNRIVFVDNDPENVESVCSLRGIKGCLSLGDAVMSLVHSLSFRANKDHATYSEVCRHLNKCYGVSTLPCQARKQLIWQRGIRASEVLAIVPTNPSKQAKYHLIGRCCVLQATKDTHRIATLIEAEQLGLHMCRVCDYNVQTPETHKYCQAADPPAPRKIDVKLHRD